MSAVNTDYSTMVRRCLLTFKPFRIFVAGIGFFSLCFLMTSLGGQFSAKRPGDTPFTMRAEADQRRLVGGAIGGQAHCKD
uniref:Alpha-1,6-mannosylglycoprotein 6-beta-N-acetylglucosaminyltransferase B n=3 Tax=Salmoninae TaxID=504568 RepID=A0A8C7CGX6_ONCKI